MRDDGDQFDGERILFWPEHELAHVIADYERATQVKLPRWATSLAHKLDLIISRRYGCEPGQPKDFAGNYEVTLEDRKLVIATLAAGKEGTAYMGYAECRICGERLGTRDLYGFGFVWPERADHYLTAHDVWTPGCAKLLGVVRARSTAP